MVIRARTLLPKSTAQTIVANITSVMKSAGLLVLAGNAMMACMWTLSVLPRALLS
jgi:hypothetical protein